MFEVKENEKASITNAYSNFEVLKILFIIHLV
jgi:hypothetical protein